MFDKLKTQNLSVDAATLLTDERLNFALPIEEQTGAVLTDRYRTATDRKLKFTLKPRKSGGFCVELEGSIHYYSRGGLHNADDFTAAELLNTLDQLVTTYQIDPFSSRLNNIEFGVNIVLPFPARKVLDNLVMYKYHQFVKEQENDFTYYQCKTQRYAVKLYAKGEQFPEHAPGFADRLLRVEIKVLKMEYLTRQGIELGCLADLLNVANYRPLGALLVETFTEILFDEPTINQAQLTARERDVYKDGRNPRFWSTSKRLPRKEYDRLQKSLKRAETKFRAILKKYRRGDDWQRLTAALIGQTWERLVTVNNDLLTRINERRAAWENDIKTKWTEGNNSRQTVAELPEKCPLLTGVSEPNTDRETLPATALKCPILTGVENGEMSDINRLSVVLISDNGSSLTTDHNAGRETPQPTTNNSDRIVRKGRVSKLRTNRPTATQLRANPNLLAEVVQDRKQYAKGSKENDFERAAHNLRNDDSNPRNYLAQRLRRIVETPDGHTMQLFAPVAVIRLTPDQKTALDYWKGTEREVRF